VSSGRLSHPSPTLSRSSCSESSSAPSRPSCTH